MYNTVASWYELLAAAQDAQVHYEAIQQALSAHLGGDVCPAASPGALADLGAGTGAMAHRFVTQTPWHLYCLELSAAMLAEAEKKRARLDESQQQRWTLCQGDISNWQRPQHWPLFHGAYCLHNTLNHLTMPQQLAGFWRDAYAALCPGGLLMLDTDTWRTFTDFFDFSPTLVWQDAHQQVLRACQLNRETGRAQHRLTLRRTDPATGKTTQIEETMDLQYHPEEALYAGFSAAGFRLLSATPINVSPALYQGFIPKIWWVLQKSASV
jgi:SAM-dependent methyltransferase